MNKELLIFGAYGALGRGAAASLIEEDYSKIFLFDPHINSPVQRINVRNIKIGDLSVEEEAASAFANILPSKDKHFFLFSTIGGFWGGKSIAETGTADWDKMFEVNLKTNFQIAKQFSSLVNKSAGGSICFTAAISALKPAVRRAAYDASKSALISMVKTLALEGAEYNLSVNAVAPYIIDTPSNRKWMPDSDFESWVKPSEIGKLVGSVFSNFNILTGNVFEISNRFKIR